LEKKSEFRGIVRVSGKDVKGELPMSTALTKVRGIGVNLADSIANIASKKLKIDKLEMIGNLTDAQLDELEKIIASPLEHGVPEWAVNRRKETSGKSVHLATSDLDFTVKKNIEHEKNIKSYRGIRHMFGLPVRGQRTKTMGRKGMTMGVVKKKQAPSKAGDKKGKKK
jgi:small subunit ribosomal protein S13